MTASKHYDLARMTTTTTGVGAITLGSAVTGFLTFAAAGVQHNDIVTYAIEDGNNREIGWGGYNANNSTLTRGVLKSTNNDKPISLSGSAQVFVSAAAEDLALASMSDVYIPSAPPASSILSYAVGTTPTLVQSAGSVIGGTNTITLGSAPTVGNTLVLVQWGNPMPATQTGFNQIIEYTSDALDTTTFFREIHIHTRVVQSGDGTAWTFTGDGSTYMTSGVLLEVSGSFAVSVVPFTPTVSGNTYTEALTSVTGQLQFGFFANTNSIGYSSNSGPVSLLHVGYWFGQQQQGFQYTGNGTLTVTYDSAPPSHTAYNVLISAVNAWKAVDMLGLVEMIATNSAALAALSVALGGGGSGSSSTLTAASFTVSGIPTGSVHGFSQSGLSGTVGAASAAGSLTPNTFGGQTIVSLFSAPGNTVLLAVSGTSPGAWFTTVSIPGIGVLDFTSATVSTSGSYTTYEWGATGTVTSGNITFT